MNAMNTQWLSRPADEKLLTLDDLYTHLQGETDRSRSTVVSNRKIHVAPAHDVNSGPSARELTISTDGRDMSASHWSFGQLSALVGAPAGYMRKLPAPIAADCLNWGLHRRQVDEIGIYSMTNDDGFMLRAATGPNYGRIHTTDLVETVRDMQGDWTPMQMYASDRDAHMFLVDEDTPIEVGRTYKGEPELISRGFVAGNSEVGSKTLWFSSFLWRWACSNRQIITKWDVESVRIRHTSGAPDRWREEIQPAIAAYSAGNVDGIVSGIRDAKDARFRDQDDALKFLTEKRYGFAQGNAKAMLAQYEAEEGGAVQNVWDATQAVTGYAKNSPHQDTRVTMETIAGRMLESV
jgi:hypothetical protein